MLLPIMTLVCGTWNLFQVRWIGFSSAISPSKYINIYVFTFGLPQSTVVTNTSAPTGRIPMDPTQLQARSTSFNRRWLAPLSGQSSQAANHMPCNEDLLLPFSDNVALHSLMANGTASRHTSSPDRNALETCLNVIRSLKWSCKYSPTSAAVGSHFCLFRSSMRARRARMTGDCDELARLIQRSQN